MAVAGGRGDWQTDDVSINRENRLSMRPRARVYIVGRHVQCLCQYRYSGQMQNFDSIHSIATKTLHFPCVNLMSLCIASVSSLYIPMVPWLKLRFRVDVKSRDKRYGSGKDMPSFSR